MAEKFSFFDPVLTESGLPDREYNAQEFTDYFGALVTTGVMKGEGAELKVSANGSNMITEIDTGIAFVDDKYYENTAKLAHTHDTETLGKNRIDRIVIRKDLNTDARWTRSFVKKGIASASPVAPALTRNETVYEISLAQVKVVGGQTYISASNVTDERGKDVVCPWAGSKILPNFDEGALDDLMNSIGSPNGIAQLGPNGKVPAGQLDVRPPADATTTTKGIVKLNDNLDSPLPTEAATANAVKKVNDKLISKNVSLGMDSSAFVEGVALGTKSKVWAEGSMAFGMESTAYGKNSMAVGNKASTLGENDIAIGLNSRTQGSSGGNLALGINSNASGGSSFALGNHANALNGNDAAIGSNVNRVSIPGSLNVTGTKQFQMPHPHPDKKDTHVLRHSAVESPTAGDNLYRYTVEATSDGETVELQLPDYFKHLNKDVDVYVSPHMHFGRSFGIVEGDFLKVTCEKAGTYKAIVIGTRNDDHESVQTWDVKGVEREIGESWTGETYSYEVDEILEVQEITQGVA